MKTSPRALLLALLTAVAAIAALTLVTLTAGAQTPGGEPDPGESGSTETAQGRIIARVHDRTGEDGVDDYRIEFGFFPEWALDEAESWPEAIASRSDWLPSSRFLTKRRIDDRADDDDRSWLRSSLITVPAQSAQSPGGAEITGRVLARYNPDSDGRLRDQFGFGDLRLEFLFVPAWAFTDTSSTAEAVARLSADNLPRARYLSVATIDARRDIWLRSSVVNVPLRAPVVVIEQPQAPVIDDLSCSPSSLTVGEETICTAELSGGAPESWVWDVDNGSGGSGSGGRYTTSFSRAGEQTVSLTVINSAGRDRESITVSVAEALHRPVIDSLSCSPSSLTVGEETICIAELNGSAPESYSWSGGSAASDSDYYTTSFSKAGEYTVSLTVTNWAGSDTESTTVSVEEPAVQPPVIDSISCSPSSPPVDQSVTCTATLSGGAPASYSWSGGTLSGSSATYNTSLLGSTAVSLTVTNVAGSDTDSIIVNIAAILAPVIDRVSCTPASPTVDQSVTCRAVLSYGYNASYSWSGGASSSSSTRSGNTAIYNTSFSSAGSKTVSVTATNAAGSDTESGTLTVTP